MLSFCVKQKKRKKKLKERKRHEYVDDNIVSQVRSDDRNQMIDSINVSANKDVSFSDKHETSSVKHKKKKKKKKKKKLHAFASDNHGVRHNAECQLLRIWKKKKRCQKTSPIDDSVVSEVRSDCISPSVNVSLSDKHETVTSSTETFADSQLRLHDKKSQKRKRRHNQEDMLEDQNKHCKYQKLECAAEMNGQTMQKEHHIYIESSSRKHSTVEKLSKLLPECCDTLPEVPCTDNGQHQEKHKKKKLHVPQGATMKFIHNGSADSHIARCDANFQQLYKHKKKKKSKKTRHIGHTGDSVVSSEGRCDDNDQLTDYVNLSADADFSASEHASSSKKHTAVEEHLPVCCDTLPEKTSNSNGQQQKKHKKNNAELGNSHVMRHGDNYQPLSERKRRKKCNKTRRSNLSANKLKKRSSCLPVSSVIIDDENVSQDATVKSVLNSSSAKKLGAVKSVKNMAGVINILHAKNSLYYLRCKADVKEAGQESIVPYFCNMLCINLIASAKEGVFFVSLCLCLQDNSKVAEKF